jgi:uncharacterized protein (DUF1697 family)
MGKTETGYIAILRGINVSGKNIIRMDALRELFISMGFSDVVTYIQSGNAVFRAHDTGSEALVSKISEGISKTFGLKVPVIARTSAELSEVIGKNPFLKEKDILVEKLHVTFLSAVPASEDVKKLESVRSGNDRFIQKGREIYLYCPNGYGNTKLSNTAIESKLKVTATTRNWNTINKLLDLSNQHPVSRI